MDVKLPKLGEGAESGTVASIFVKVGDMVSEGQTIVELENEKAVAPIPSPAHGRVVSLRVSQGDRLVVGQVILTLDTGGGRPALTATEARSSVQSPELPSESEVRAEVAEPVTEFQAPEPEVAAGAVPTPESRLGPAAAPSIRKLARELGIDLTKVRGSERGGRIILADLRAYIQRLQQLAFQPKPAAALAKPPGAVVSVDFSKWGPVSRKPMSPLRQTIARRMAESWDSVPRVTQFDEVDITKLREWQKKYAPAYEKQGAKLTLTVFALKAVAQTLAKHPIFNSSLDEATHEIVLKQYYHIGVAVDTEQGLIVPVVRDVNKKSMLELSREILSLAEKAKQRKLTLEELKGGTFTISNQGGIGGGHFTPIINKPEVAILGLGRGALKPVVKEGQILTRWMMPLTIAYDHRVIDGGGAARFCVDLVAAMEGFNEDDVNP